MTASKSSSRRDDPAASATSISGAPSGSRSHEPWSAPVPLGPQVNTEFVEVFPSLSSDAETLVFQSTRPGGFGGSDIYVTTR